MTNPPTPPADAETAEPPYAAGMNRAYRDCAVEIAGVLDVTIPADLPPDGEGWDWLITHLREVLRVGERAAEGLTETQEQLDSCMAALDALPSSKGEFAAVIAPLAAWSPATGPGTSLRREAEDIAYRAYVLGKRQASDGWDEAQNEAKRLAAESARLRQERNALEERLREVAQQRGRAIVERNEWRERYTRLVGEVEAIAATIHPRTWSKPAGQALADVADRLRSALAATAPQTAPAQPAEESMQDSELLVDPLLEAAWGVIANAGQGDWERESAEWQEAARRWRDQYHDRLRSAHPAGDEHLRAVDLGTRLAAAQRERDEARREAERLRGEVSKLADEWDEHAPHADQPAVYEIHAEQLRDLLAGSSDTTGGDPQNQPANGTESTHSHEHTPDAATPADTNHAQQSPQGNQ